MTPIEWNESEPTFPDFLPPIKHKLLTREFAEERLKGVLEAAGITALIYGTVLISYPDGTVYGPAEFCVDADGLSHQRG